MREANAISRSLYKKAAEIPIGNGFVPAILPLLALSSIHTYTTLSVRSYNPPATHEVAEAEPKEQEIRNIPSQASDGDNTLHRVAYNEMSDENSLHNLFEKRLKAKPQISSSVRPKYTVPDITRGALIKKELSITFDGGSEAAGAEEILRTLREKNVKTTIFLTGEFIKSYPELVKEMVEDGHEIGNHSLSHPHLTTFASNYRQQTLSSVDKEFITRQLKETARIFKELTGKDMIPFWRAPYGEQNAEIRQWAYEAGFTHIGWTANRKTKQSLDSLDWVANEESEFYHSADEIKQRILNFDKNGNEVRGGIVLMHLGTERKSSHAHTKLPEIINSLEERGYRFVKVSELLKSSR